MRIYKEHLINIEKTIKDALNQLNDLSQDAILFVVNSSDVLIGSLTDGDIRRGLLNNFQLDDYIKKIIQPAPRYIRQGEDNIHKIIQYRENGYRILPVLDIDNKVINVINFRNLKSFIPIDVVIMAGGRGQRLQPLTDLIPKPLLRIGEKPIIEYNIDRLVQFGIENIWISLRYLGEQIECYFNDGRNKNISIEYIWENEALGTIGAVSNINNFKHDHVLITNSDVLSNIDYEQFYLDFIKQDADLAVLTIPYQVNIPYAVLETDNNNIISFKEKPTYTYYSNGGIYLIKKKVLENIPKNIFFNSTDLMEILIKKKYKVISYPFLGYWLDIGKHEDYKKAQIDILTINF